MKRLIIFGAGEIAQIARHYFETYSAKEVSAFVVDESHLYGDSFDGLPLVSSDNVSKSYPAYEYDCFVGISYQKMNQTRKQKCDLMRSYGYKLVSFVYPDLKTNGVTFGDNCFVLENNTIQPFSQIGNNVYLWSGNHIGHHVEIKDDVFVSSHVVIGGGSVIGSGSFLGLNTTINDHVLIGERSWLASGTLVGQDLPHESVVLEKSSQISKVKSNMIGLI